MSEEKHASEGAVIREQARLCGVTQAEIAMTLGVSAANVWQWLKGMRPVPAAKAEALGALLDVDPTEISSEYRKLQSARQEFVTIPAPGGGSERDDVTVRFMPTKHASAGHGAMNHEEEGDPLGLRFSSVSLRKHGIPPDKAMIIYARGDSMETDISDGDVILFDTSRTVIKDGRPYVIEVDGEESVKLLHRRPGNVVLVQSKNADYPPYEVRLDQEGFRVLGEVMWRAGWI